MKDREKIAERIERYLNLTLEAEKEHVNRISKFLEYRLEEAEFGYLEVNKKLLEETGGSTDILKLEIFGRAHDYLHLLHSVDGQKLPLELMLLTSSEVVTTILGITPDTSLYPEEAWMLHRVLKPQGMETAYPFILAKDPLVTKEKEELFGNLGLVGQRMPNASLYPEDHDQLRMVVREYAYAIGASLDAVDFTSGTGSDIYLNSYLQAINGSSLADLARKETRARNVHYLDYINPLVIPELISVNRDVPVIDEIHRVRQTFPKASFSAAILERTGYNW